MNSGAIEIRGGDYEGGGAASSSLKRMLKALGTDGVQLRRAMIAAYEAEMNVVVHARQGRLRYCLDPGQLEVEVADSGPGIPDIELAMQEGWSTAPPEARQLGFGAGMGLPNIRRNTDLLEIRSTVGEGTVVSFTIFLKPQTGLVPNPHSLALHSDRCTRCLRCVHACPMDALRLRGTGPELLEHLCLDCGRCVAACPVAALGMAHEELAPSALAPASPTPEPLPPSGPLALHRAFLAQFGPLVRPELVLRGLEQLGFGPLRFLDDWHPPLEQALVDAPRAPDHGPLIAPGCPAALRLLAVRFPGLLGQVAPWQPPVVALWRAHRMDGLQVLPTCLAQRTLLLQEGAAAHRLLAPGPLAAALKPLLRQLRRQPPPAPPVAVPAPDPAVTTTVPGQRLHVTGPDHVLRVFEALENGQLTEVALVDPWLCDGGCWGGPLWAEDPVLASHRAGRVATPAPEARPTVLARTRPLAPRAGLRLDQDMTEAVAKLARIDALTRALPGRDCGVCGAPTCAALAEDVVLGRIARADCPFVKPEVTP